MFRTLIVGLICLCLSNSHVYAWHVYDQDPGDSPHSTLTVVGGSDDEEVIPSPSIQQPQPLHAHPSTEMNAGMALYCSCFLIIFLGGLKLATEAANS